MKLLISTVLLLSSLSAFSGTLMAKYKCVATDSQTGEEEDKLSIMIYVSENYLCGEAGKKYEMAAGILDGEGTPVPMSMMVTGKISYSSDMTVEASTEEELEDVGTLETYKLVMNIMNPEKSSIKTLVDLTDAGEGVYMTMPATCQQVISYNMDC